MPLTQVSVRKGKSQDQITAILDAIYDAMQETFAVPDDDRFMTVSEFEDAGYSYGRRYPGVSRSEDLIIIQVTVSNNRSMEQKLALYRAVNDGLAVRAGIRPDDVFINIVEVAPENWSFGHGRAQNIE